MPITFYLGPAAVEFKQYAAYLQRRTATRAAQLTPPPDQSTGTSASTSEWRRPEHLETILWVEIHDAFHQVLVGRSLSAQRQPVV